MIGLLKNYWKGRYYESIDDCPIIVFHQIMQGEHYSNLYRSGLYRPERAYNAWKKIFNEYLNAFGLPESYVQYMTKMQKAAEYWAKSMDERFYKTLAEASEREAEIALNTEKGQDFNTLVAMVSKKMGFRVNPKEISVREFYSYVNG